MTSRGNSVYLSSWVVNTGTCPLALFSQKALVPDHYESTGAAGACDLTADDLAGFVADTKQVLDDGGLIPVYHKHVPPNSPEDGPFFGSSNAESHNVLGWLTDLKLDGSDLEYTLDITNPDTNRKIGERTIRRSSPELDTTYRNGPRNYGKVIRHVALTAEPRNEKQSEFQELPQFSREGTSFMGTPSKIQQFSLQPFAMDDPEEDRKKKEKESAADKTPDTQTSDGSNPGTEEKTVDDIIADPPPNPPTTDRPPETEASNESPALTRAILTALGVFVPDGVELNLPSDAMESLKAALEAVEGIRTKVAEMEKREQEALSQPAQLFDRNTASPTEIALYEELQKQNDRIQTFERERTEGAVEQGKANQLLAINQAKIAPGLKRKLIEMAGIQQFDNTGAASPMLSLAQAAQLFSQFTPDNMLPEPGTVEAPAHHDSKIMNAPGDGSNESDEDAAAGVDEQLKHTGFVPSGADPIDWKNPNQNVAPVS